MDCKFLIAFLFFEKIIIIYVNLSGKGNWCVKSIGIADTIEFRCYDETYLMEDMSYK